MYERPFAPFREVHKGQVAYINPLLECEDEGSAASSFFSFQPAVQNTVTSEIKAGKARSIAVYFRDLNSGRSFGINENEKFIPASLLKVPLMMAYLKKAETTPSFLRKQLTFHRDVDLTQQNIRSVEGLLPGRQYTVDSLIDRMIMHSDNEAADTLLLNDRDHLFDKVFSDLGFAAPLNEEPEFYITVKDYASFFRVLYNGSYLNEEMSNRALKLLSKVYFQGGIVAGLPENIDVAHKFGERRVNDVMQFHDCGIVYFPKRPYLLCVMTRGDELATMVSAVQNISGAVYEGFSRRVQTSMR